MSNRVRAERLAGILRDLMSMQERTRRITDVLDQPGMEDCPLHRRQAIKLETMLRDWVDLF